MGRARDIAGSAWKLVVGAPWDHDLIDPSHPPAIPLEPLGPWYYDLGRSITRGDYRFFDDAGIPRELFGGRLIYHPSRVASFCLAYTGRHILKGEPEDLQVAVKAARWLVDNQEGSGRLEGAFPIPFDWGRVKGPWPSCLTQGLALSALARLYRLTGDERLGAAARAAVIPLQRPIEDGGLQCMFHDTGKLWLEEHPDLVDPSHILNGFIYAVWGLRDAGLIGVLGARDLYRRAVRSLADTLTPYDCGYWSYYQYPEHSRPRMASLAYHRLHGVMLRILSSLEPDKIFCEMADRWESYAARPTYRLRVLLAKLGDTQRQKGRPAVERGT
jgi:hypothetical protein